VSEQPPVKIGVLIPAHDQLPAPFAVSLANMVGFTAAMMPENAILGTTMVMGTYAHTARQELLESALADDLDFALWVDSDMTFPKETLLALMRHNLPMVGINYSTREPGGKHVAIKTTHPGAPLVTGSTSTGLEEVEGIGFGAVLLRMRDFQGLRDIPAHRWFAPQYREEMRTWVGEDIAFCELVRKELGHRIFVDHDLSLDCGHVGSFTYRLQHLEAL